MRLINEGKTTGDRSWISPEQNTDLVLRLRYGLFAENDLSFRLLKKKIRLVHVANGTITAFIFDGVNPQDILIGDDISLREIQLIIELTQLKIGDCYVRNQSCLNDASGISGREQLCTGCLGSAAVFSPKIHDITQLNSERHYGWTVRYDRVALIVHAARAGEVWQLIGPRLSHNRLGLDDAGGSNLHVVIV